MELAAQLPAFVFVCSAVVSEQRPATCTAVALTLACDAPRLAGYVNQAPWAAASGYCKLLVQIKSPAPHAHCYITQQQDHLFPPSLSVFSSEQG